MKTSLLRGGWIRTWLTASGLLAFGGCGLSDQQLTQVFTSVLTTGLNSLIVSLTTALTGGAA